MDELNEQIADGGTASIGAADFEARAEALRSGVGQEIVLAAPPIDATNDQVTSLGAGLALREGNSASQEDAFSGDEGDAAATAVLVAVEAYPTFLARYYRKGVSAIQINAGDGSDDADRIARAQAVRASLSSDEEDAA